MMSSKKLIVHEKCSVNNKNIWYNVDTEGRCVNF